MADRQWLPIKVVFPSVADRRAPHISSRPFAPFCTVDQPYRDKLASEVRGVRQAFRQSLSDGLPGVAKVILKDEATRKSYRPTALLNPETCPIIGVGSAGVLLASITNAGLSKLEDTISHGTEGETVPHLSTLDAISPFSEADALSASAVQVESRGKTALRVKLFRHGNTRLDAKIDDAFLQYASDSGIDDVAAVNYGRGVKIYRCATANPDSAGVLARFIGTQSVCSMPRFHPVHTASRALGPVTAAHFSLPDPNRDYPIVGMFDSGTDPNNHLLQAWVVARVDDYFDQSIQDNSHASFVGGLLANGKQLNFDDLRFPSASVKFVDVVVFNRTGQVEESDLLMMIRESLEKFPYVRVWNLSLASNDYTCLDNEISEFGATLDEYQRQFGVLFVCASGNLNSGPLRQWPVPADFASDDRVAPPADSFRGLTVGGLAHLENERTFAGRENVSPFSRRGPGMGCVIKPEVSHYAGNCDGDGNYMQTGVVSLDGQGNLAEDIGVSFATPLVTAIAGTVAHEMGADPDPVSPCLLKGMVVHAACVANGPIDPAIVEYVGCGKPPDPHHILSCHQSSATVVFKADALRRDQFIKRNFPIPECLKKSGELLGEMLMTVIYDPPLDRDFGIQYCRRDIRASLGTLKFDPETGKMNYTRQVHPAPDKLRQRYTKELADFGLDWSPMKLYYRRFKEPSRGEGLVGLDWQLSLPVQNRAECDDESPLPVTVILTIRSDDENDDVYSEMVRAMDNLGWRVGDLEIRSRVRTEEGQV